jgi:integrase
MCTLISVLYSAGLRRGELLNLKLNDIDGKRMLITVRAAKGNKDRVTILSPNDFPINQRIKVAQHLSYALYNKLESEGEVRRGEHTSEINSDIALLEKALDKKLKSNFSKHHKTALKYAYTSLSRNVINDALSAESIEKTLNYFNNATSYNTVRRNLIVLINEAISIGLKFDITSVPKPKRAKARLHKSYQNITEILEDIKAFDHNLYLCCLFTYGCLLRPHREIRELKWGDFSVDLKHIHLSGSRNKSGRNRIVPVPEFIRAYLFLNDFFGHYSTACCNVKEVDSSSKIGYIY